MEINTVTKNYNERNEFCSYQVTYTNSNIIKSVPNDPTNTDYQKNSTMDNRWWCCNR